MIPDNASRSPSADNRRCAAYMHGAVQKVKKKGWRVKREGQSWIDERLT